MRACYKKYICQFLDDAEKLQTDILDQQDFVKLFIGAFYWLHAVFRSIVDTVLHIVLDKFLILCWINELDESEKIENFIIWFYELIIHWKFEKI